MNRRPVMSTEINDTKSKELFEAAKKHIPGGVNSPEHLEQLEELQDL